jgi:A nuclease family of the HNH/ENDO VII superfamily with conserved AHH
VVAELATFGGATFFPAGGAGLAAGGALAARGWEQWDDLSTAAGAGASEQGQIVSQAQAGAALTGAVIDSAFAFLDVIPALRAVRAAAGARHGAASAAGAAGQGIESLARGEPSGALVARGVAGEGIEQSARQGGEAAARGAGAASMRLRAQEAGNWQDIAQGFLGRKLDEVGVPPGYATYEIDGRPFLRRIEGADERFAQLTVDDGVIRVGPASSTRLGRTERREQSIASLLARHGLTERPPHHEAHHVVPDEIARKQELMHEAHGRDLFDLDASENLALLARRTGDDGAPVAKVPGLSEGLPTHQGPHPKYSLAVTRAADKVMGELLADGGKLAELSDEVLRAAAVKVRDLAWKILKSWEGPHLK